MERTISFRRMFRACTVAISLFLTASTYATGVHTFVRHPYSQELELNFSNAPIIEIMDTVTVQSGYRFVYSDELKPRLGTRISIVSDGETLASVLDRIFNPAGISYRIEGNSIALRVKAAATTDSGTAGKVSGTVTDTYGTPIAGVVIKSGNGKYAVSGTDGVYTIEAGKNDILIFSSNGYKEKSIAVTGLPIVDATLEESIEMLDGVVITGYQEISKERATGSYSTVSASEIGLRPSTNLATALAGVTPGMTQDADNRFVIRGVGNISAYGDSNPLIVIDGFPVQSYESSVDPFEMINPNDVESVTVLKDAAATSIYGARAANGVIVITTKKASGKDRINIDFDARVSVSSRYDLEHFYNFTDGQSMIKYMTDLEQYSTVISSINVKPTWIYNPMPELTSLLYEYKKLGNLTEDQYNSRIRTLLDNEGKYLEEYNKYLFRNAIKQQYNLNINGNSAKNSYRLSLSYNNETGSSIGDTGNRFLLNLNDTYRIVKGLSVSINATLNYRNSKENGISPSATLDYTTPFTTLFNADGSYANIARSGSVYYPAYEATYKGKTPASWEFNPLEDRGGHNTVRTNIGARVQGSIDYRPVKTLNISLKAQYERTQQDTKSETFANSFTIRDLYNKFSTLDENTGMYVSKFPEGGMIELRKFHTSSYNLRAQIDYNEIYGGKHELTLMGLAELSSSLKTFEPNYTAYGYDPYTNLTQETPDNFNKYATIFGGSSKFPEVGLGSLSTIADRYLSMAFNLAYAYDSRYVLSGSIRADASNFVTDVMANRFSPFYSVGLLWNIDKEKFLMGSDAVDRLKVRASYGTAGIAAGKRNISTLTTIKTDSGDIDYTNNEPYATVNIKGNPSLTWEKSRTINAGVDFSFWRNKLYGSVEFYDKYSYDVIAEATVPYIVQSSSSMIYNNAAISNKGVELTLGSRIGISDKASWTGDLNFSYNKNRVMDYNVKPTVPGGNYVEGYPLSPVWAYKLSGYTSEGLLKLTGKDGTEVIVDSKDNSHLEDKLEEGQKPDENNWLRYYGTTVAPYNMSFRSTFKFYGVTLSLQFTGSFGHLFNYTNNESGIIDYRTKGIKSYLKDALAMDASNYTAGYITPPVYSAKNSELFKAGNLYTYTFKLYNQADWHWRDASNIRLQSIYLGYELPAKILQKTCIQGLGFYSEVNNIGPVLLVNKDGIDPLAVPGTLKPLVNYTFGLKVNF